MKITHHFPVHPHYFGGRYSQQRIIAALKNMDAAYDGKCFQVRSYQLSKGGYTEVYNFLTEPGHKVRSVIEKSDGVPPTEKDIKFADTMRTSTLNELVDILENKKPGQ